MNKVSLVRRISLSLLLCALLFPLFSCGEAADPAEQNGVYETETTPGDVFRFVSGKAPVLEREYAPNTGVKILGNAKLGTEKEFDSL